MWSTARSVSEASLEFFRLITRAAHNEVLVVVAETLTGILRQVLKAEPSLKYRPELVPVQKEDSSAPARARRRFAAEAEMSSLLRPDAARRRRDPGRRSCFGGRCRKGNRMTVSDSRRRRPRNATCSSSAPGAGGLSTAITAKKNGLDVDRRREGERVRRHHRVLGRRALDPAQPRTRPRPASATNARRCCGTCASETGQHFDAAAVDAFIDRGPEAVVFFDRETEVQVHRRRSIPTITPGADGGVDIGRSITAAPFDIRRLGKDMARLRRPLATLTFVGMMFNSSSADLKHFFNATRSLRFGVLRRQAAVEPS